jgi:putative hydrolase of the HAD superfamily
VASDRAARPPPIDQVPAILFDFGGTLVVLEPSREELFLQAARAVGLSISPEAIGRAYRIVDFHLKYSSVKIQGDRDRAAFYERYHYALCEALGIASWFTILDPALRSHFAAHRRWVVAPRVPAVLRRLRDRGVALGIVANWDRNLGDLAAALDLRPYFSCIVSSAAAGVEKPAAAIFERAVAELGMAGREPAILYVGDEYRADVVGARGAGLSPVLIDRRDEYPHADCPRFRSVEEWSASLDLADLTGEGRP